MNTRALTISLAWLVATALPTGPTPAAEVAMQPDRPNPERFVVVDHMNGHLALAVSEISSAWRREPSGDQTASLRLTSAALSEAKVLVGDAADSLWRTLSEGDLADRFVLVSHLGGTLAVPRDQIRTAFFSDQNGARLRLVYAGDPSGKELEGDEALRVWKLLTG